MTQVLNIYESDKSLHAKRAEELEKLNQEHNKNKLKMGDQNSKIDELEEKMEKLNIELTVVTTEKISYKKEVDRIQNEKTMLTLEFRALREMNNLNLDEIAKANKQNAEYRGIIIGAEEAQNDLNNDIIGLQQVIDRKNKTIAAGEDETKVYKLQIDKLLKELADKSGSESYSDEEKKLEQVKKAL